jgi:hypothetical protein
MREPPAGAALAPFAPAFTLRKSAGQFTRYSSTNRFHPGESSKLLGAASGRRFRRLKTVFRHTRRLTAKSAALNGRSVTQSARVHSIQSA